MIFDYYTITLVISGLALVISIFSSGYTYYQNKRKVEANLWIDYGDVPNVTFCGFNPRYRSVALINFKLLVNNQPVTFSESFIINKKDNKNSKMTFRVLKRIEFPHVLSEGSAVFFTITAWQLARFLHHNNFSGVIKLSAYFKTAEQKEIKSKSTINFDIDEYRKADYVNRSYFQKRIFIFDNIRYLPN